MPFIAVETKLNRWATVIANFKPAVADIIGKVTLDGYARSQIDVPVRRPDVVASTGVTGGFLKQSGQVSVDSGALEGEIKYVAYYAGYVHEGTYKMPARPFLSDALDGLLPSMYAAFTSLERRLA